MLTKFSRALSLYFTTLIKPIKKASMALRAANIVGNANTRLLKNVIPPRCPEAIRARHKPIRAKKETHNLTDHLPGVDFGNS